MDTWRPKMGYHLIYDRMPDGSQMKTPRPSFFMECCNEFSVICLPSKKSTRGVSAKG